MNKYKVQKLIFSMRKLISIMVLILTPYITYRASAYANSLREIQALGGELFVPPLLVIISYYIYPKYKLIKK